jgi:hypothetical protein
MRRIRLSTLMLLIVIAAQGIALAVQQVRSSRCEAELRGKLQFANERNNNLRQMLKHEKMMARMQFSDLVRLQMEKERERLGVKAAGVEERTTE